MIYQLSTGATAPQPNQLNQLTMSAIEKTASILIIGKVEDETRKLADALAADYHISAAPNVAASARRRLTKESFSAIIFDLLDDGSDLAKIL
jgi:hypothetical protein